MPERPNPGQSLGQSALSPPPARRSRWPSPTGAEEPGTRRSRTGRRQRRSRRRRRGRRSLQRQPLRRAGSHRCRSRPRPPWLLSAPRVFSRAPGAAPRARAGCRGCETGRRGERDDRPQAPVRRHDRGAGAEASSLKRTRSGNYRGSPYPVDQPSRQRRRNGRRQEPRRDHESDSRGARAVERVDREWRLRTPSRRCSPAARWPGGSKENSPSGGGPTCVIGLASRAQSGIARGTESSYGRRAGTTTWGCSHRDRRYTAARLAGVSGPADTLAMAGSGDPGCSVAAAGQR